MHLLPFRWDLTKAPACEVIRVINRFLTVGDVRRDISILCGRNSLHDLHDPNRHAYWIELSRLILVELYDVYCSPCSFTSNGRAGNFLISLWQFIQENYYLDNMIPANYTSVNSAPQTPIPQFFLNAARDLRLPMMNIDDIINNNNNDNDNNEREDEGNDQALENVENGDLMEDYAEEHLDDDVNDDDNNNNNIEEDADVVGENNNPVAYMVGVNNLPNADENGPNNFPDAFEVGDNNLEEADVVGDNNPVAYMVGAENLPLLIPGENELYIEIFNRRWDDIFMHITENAVRDTQRNPLLIELIMTRINTLRTALISSVPHGFAQRELDVLNADIPEGIFHLARY